MFRPHAARIIRVAADRQHGAEGARQPRKLSGKRTASDRTLWREGVSIERIGGLAEGYDLRQTDRGGAEGNGRMPRADARSLYPENLLSNPSDLKYTESHEWLRREQDGTVTVGITHHAQDELGELVYVELPAVGRALAAREACCVVESTKAASDVYAPIAGTIVAVNAALADAPQTVNEKPFGEGWLFRLQPESLADLDPLMSARDYEKAIGA